MNSFKKLIVIGGVGLLMLTIRIFCGASNLQKQLEQPDILSYEVVPEAIHSQFKANSRHLNVRNGVGILPNGNLLFALSTKAVNFYTFAKFFQNHGCKNALYLDGFVSRMYLPSQNWMQEDGDFGVLIGEVK